MTARVRQSIASAATAILVCVLVLLASAPSLAASDADTIGRRANAARAAEGLAPLVRNASLDAVALAWAHHMADEDEMSHNPDVAEQIPGGWRRLGENVAQGYPTGAAMHAGWMNSDGHRANILGDYTDIGIAFLEEGGTTWGVQVFASYPGSASRPAPASPSATVTPKPSTSPKSPAATSARPSATPPPTRTPTRVPTAPPSTQPATTPTTSTPSAGAADTESPSPAAAADMSGGPPGGAGAGASGPFDGVGRTATAGALAAVAAVGAVALLFGRGRRTAAAGRHRG